MKTVRVGLIGFGFIGRVHAYGYATLPFHCDPVPLEARIAHVVASRADSAERARRLVGADGASTDYRDVTEDPAIDVVHICTPNHLHKDALLSAMRHGKHIYCEKPLCATAAEADEIAAALPAYRGIAQMTFQNRFFAATQRAKRLVDEGRLGQLLGFRACYLHGGSADPNAPLRWKLSAAAGGGVIGDLASHVVDLLDWLVGPLAAVCAATHIAYPDRPAGDGPRQRVDAEDAVALLARTAGGALGTIEATKIATGAEDELRIELHGAAGAVRFNGMDPHHLEYFDAAASAAPLGGDRGWIRIAAGHRYEPPQTNFPTPKAAVGWVRSHAACLVNFLQAVADGRPAEPGLAQGVRVQRLLDAIGRSARQRCWVEA